MTDLILTVGDTAPDLTMICMSDDVPASLTGASVSVHVRKPDGTTFVRVGATSPDEGGGVTLTWEVGDLTIQGIWQVEAEVLYSSGRVQTFGPARFAVHDQLA